MKLILLLITSLSTLATADQVTTTKRTHDNAKSESNTWTVSASIQASSTLQKSEEEGRDANLLFQVAPAYQINENYRVLVGLSTNQSLSRDQRTTFGNTAIHLSRSPINLTESDSLIMRMGGRLPTNPDDHRLNTFNGALQGTIQIVDRVDLALPLSIATGLTVLKNFHTYDYNNLGQANVSHTVQPSIAFETSITSSIKVAVTTDLTWANTYQNVARAQFSIAETLEYEQPSWRISIGHSNAGDIHKYDGRDYTIRAFDENTSIVFTSLGVNF